MKKKALAKTIKKKLAAPKGSFVFSSEYGVVLETKEAFKKRVVKYLKEVAKLYGWNSQTGHTINVCADDVRDENFK